MRACLDVRQKFLQPVFAFFELSVLQFGCQYGRCQGHCGQKLSVFGKKSYFGLVAQFIEWLYRKIALHTVK